MFSLHLYAVIDPIGPTIAVLDAVSLHARNIADNSPGQASTVNYISIHL